MAVYLETDDSSALKQAFVDAVAQSEPEGEIRTWRKSGKGEYYTHTADDWRGKAAFQPVITSAGELCFLIVNPKDRRVDENTYAYYHGHLIRTLIAHFSTMFERVYATARPTSSDRVG